jgi:hypothetical protein
MKVKSINGDTLDMSKYAVKNKHGKTIIALCKECSAQMGFQELITGNSYVLTARSIFFGDVAVNHCKHIDLAQPTDS